MLETAFLLLSLNKRRVSGNMFSGISHVKAHALMFANILKFYLLKVNIFHISLTQVNFTFFTNILNINSYVKYSLLNDFFKIMPCYA